MSKRADSWVCRSRAAPAVRTVTESSRAGAGLCSEPVQQAVLVSPISLMAWPDVTLARSVCLFSTFSAAHKNKRVFSHQAKGESGAEQAIRVSLPRRYNNATFTTLLGFHLPTDISGV